MDPATWAMIASLIGSGIKTYADSRNNNSQQQYVRQPWAGAQGEWGDLGAMLKDLMAKAQVKLNSPIDLPHTGVPELEDGRGRQVPDYLKPQPQRRVASGPSIPGLDMAFGLNAGDSQQQEQSQQSQNDSTTFDPMNPAPPDSSTPQDPFTLQAMLAKILGGGDGSGMAPLGDLNDTMKDSQSPSRISATMGQDLTDPLTLNRRRPTITPQTYGASQLLIHALTGGGQGNQRQSMFA